MTANEFIFSNKLKHRLARHLAFWGVVFLSYVIYQLSWFDNGSDVENYFFVKTYIRCFTASLIALPLNILMVYTATELLLKWYIKYGLHIRLVAGIFLVLVIDAAASWLYAIAFTYYWYKTPVEHLSFLALFGEGMNIGFFSVILKWVPLAVGIKAVKYFYFKVKENEALSQQKMMNTLALQKSRIYPRFLFKSLNTLQQLLHKEPIHSAPVILKLADILSYVLYESKVEQVSLCKEIQIIKDYIEIENLNYQNSLTVEFIIEGNSSDKNIAPLFLFSVIENQFELLPPDTIRTLIFRLSLHPQNIYLVFAELILNKKQKTITSQYGSHYRKKYFIKPINIIYLYEEI